MDPGHCFTKDKLAQLRGAVSHEPRLVAIYVFGLRRPDDCDLAALFTESIPWPERLDLEMAIGTALDVEGVELVDLRRMPLVSRFGVLDEGVPIYVGKPDVLAAFLEETIARYSAFYPLLEALYWKVETKPLREDFL
jgi:hypothetical protein